MKKVLFISYDGMTDPLGQSQILPYICGLSQEGYTFSLLSCEKENRLKQNRATIDKICEDNHINWHPILFHTKPPILSKYYDIYQLKKAAVKLYREHKFELIHCRSYISIEIGLYLKKKFGVKVIFDMRGFWVDERVDGGLWNLDKPLYKLAYAHYKKKEAHYIQNSDLIVVLTEAGKKELAGWKCYKAETLVSVVPCSADFDVFSVNDAVQKNTAKTTSGISAESIVVSYLGSLGTWYLLDEMLAFFLLLKQTYPKAIFLILTPENKNIVFEKALKLGLKESDFVIQFAQRKDIPSLIKASDFSLSFIKPAYSKIASSPTKLGELLAIGIPVICNTKIGDVAEIVAKARGGLMIDDFTEMSFKKVIDQLPAVIAVSPAEIRENIKEYYDLKNAVVKYKKSYELLIG